jgi:hypothetical protein
MRPRNIRDKTVASFVSTGVLILLSTYMNVTHWSYRMVHNNNLPKLHEYDASRKVVNTHYSTEMKHQKQLTPHFLQSIPTQLPTNLAYRTDTASCDPLQYATLKADYKATDIWTPAVP